MKTTAILLRGLTRGGVDRVLSTVVAQFPKAQPDQDHQLLVLTNKPELKSALSHLERVTVLVSPPMPLLWWDYVWSYWVLKRSKVNQVIYTKNIIPVSHLGTPWNKRLIVYDLGFMHPKLNAYKTFDTLYMRLFLGLSLKAAQQVYAISNFTKTEIIRFFKTPASKVVVWQLGVSEMFHPQTNPHTLREHDIQTPFILYCGSLSPRKNVIRLLQAFKAVQAKIPHHLYLVARVSWHDQEIQAELNQHDPGRVHVLPYVPDSTLIAMYSAAAAFVYPSLYEGFGLPIIEAQACGCPVITSNTTACRETAGDSALLCDPESVDDIGKQILTLVSDQSVRKRLIKAGFRNCQQYSWQKTAQLLFGE